MIGIGENIETKKITLFLEKTMTSIIQIHIVYHQNSWFLKKYSYPGEKAAYFLCFPHLVRSEDIFGTFRVNITISSI